MYISFSFLYTLSKIRRKFLYLAREREREREMQALVDEIVAGVENERLVR